MKVIIQQQITLLNQSEVNNLKKIATDVLSGLSGYLWVTNYEFEYKNVTSRAATPLDCNTKIIRVRKFLLAFSVSARQN